MTDISDYKFDPSTQSGIEYIEENLDLFAFYFADKQEPALRERSRKYILGPRDTLHVTINIDFPGVPRDLLDIVEKLASAELQRRLLLFANNAESSEKHEQCSSNSEPF